MSDSTLTTIDRGSCAVVIHVLPERLDDDNLSAILTATSAAGAESPQLPVILDMTNVGYMPSLSLGGLVQLLQSFKSRGQRLVLSGLQPLVRETLAITRLDKLFEIHGDLSAAKVATGTTK